MSLKHRWRVITYVVIIYHHTCLVISIIRNILIPSFLWESFEQSGNISMPIKRYSSNYFNKVPYLI